ncbi:MAG: hypothetical protein HWN68_21155 [Desulfobacterales bacterium]|nr:hypothetical protein [Desulfobacterales bacterium]
MGFTLSVENAPAPATQWGCYCNSETTLVPNSVWEQPTKPYGLLMLDERWECVDPAPGENPIDMACFDSEGHIVKESIVTVTILDDRDYIFDFATETLRIESLQAGCLPMVILCLVIGCLAVFGLLLL